MVLCQVSNSKFNFKMKTMKLYQSIAGLMSLGLAMLLGACNGFQEEYIPMEMNVDNIATFVVLNAEIEEGRKSWIQISYSEDIDALVETPVRYEENATVTLSTASGQSEMLNYKAYGVYVGSSIVGKVNETYTLTVRINEATYVATSTMFNQPGYQDGWVEHGAKISTPKGGEGAAYSEQWIVNDPSNERNRYLFEWWANGVHNVVKDWSIDDNRIVNVNEGLRMHNPTIDPSANTYLRLRAAEIDKVTYDYFNMYEKIVRGMIGADSQTPYNPTSNFGEGTIGNFRAVAFSAQPILTPPNLTATGDEEAISLSFAGNIFFTKYHLYWDEQPGIDESSQVLNDIEITNPAGKSASYKHTGLTTGSQYYYRIQAEDAEGNVSILSPEVNSTADKNTGGSTGGKNVPTNTHAKASGSGEITISWDDVSGVDGYIIYWATKTGVTSKSKYFTVTSSPYTHTGLTTGQTYYYRVGTYIGKELFLADEISAVAN